MRTYSELIRLPTFEERFEYLRLNGQVGFETFGPHRSMNQAFYHSDEWKRIRNYVIVRDGSCDLAIPDREIFARPYIHHLNPISVDDVVHSTDFLIDPENLITVTKKTHDAIHYGDGSSLTPSAPVVRRPNDTCPWKH